jgi:hypothetical protein
MVPDRLHVAKRSPTSLDDESAKRYDVHVPINQGVIVPRAAVLLLPNTVVAHAPPIHPILDTLEPSLRLFLLLDILVEGSRQEKQKICVRMFCEPT